MAGEISLNQEIGVQQEDPNSEGGCSVSGTLLVYGVVTGTNRIALAVSSVSGTEFPVHGMVTDELEKRGLISWNSRLGIYLINTIIISIEDFIREVKNFIEAIKRMNGWSAVLIK